jgi:hypothetical protein
MDKDSALAQKIDEYQKLYKDNKEIDIAALMANALSEHRDNRVSAKLRRWAYLISISAPPFGLMFALKFYFDDEEDAKHVALVCLILTVISIVMFFLFSGLLFSSAGVTPAQIEQIKPADIMQLTQ